MPVQTMVPVIFSCSVYFIIGYQLTAAKVREENSGWWCCISE